MYKIGELSKLCSLPVKTLRFYDAEGLLVPDHIDKFTGYRYYSAARLADCNRIVALKALGFSLEEIRAQLQAGQAEMVLAQVEAKAMALRVQLTEDEARLHPARGHPGYAQRRRNRYVSSCDTHGRHHTSSRAAGHISDKGSGIRALEALRASLPRPLAGRRDVIVNYETEYREKNFDLAVCVELAGRLPEGATAVEKEITFSAPTEVASIVCRREQLDEAYRAMQRQLNEAPAQIVGAFYEIYHEDGTVELKVPVCRHRGAAAAQPCAGMAPFINDSDAIGYWKMLDIVPSAEQFRYGHPKCGTSPG